MRLIGKVLLVLAGIAYPCTLHVLIRAGHISGGSMALALLPLPLLAVWLIWRLVNNRWRVPALLLVALAVWWGMNAQQDRFDLVVTSGALHAIPNLLMLWLFGHTLLPGRTPLITSLSQHINGELTPTMLTYTRRVTLAWTCYFAGQLLLSLTLYLFAPLDTWSLFINVLDWPLLVLMFIGEYLWRITRYPGHSKTSIRKAIEAYTQHVVHERKV
jgi:uncharacterized membrane protein